MSRQEEASARARWWGCGKGSTHTWTPGSDAKARPCLAPDCGACGPAGAPEAVAPPGPLGQAWIQVRRRTFSPPETPEWAPTEWLPGVPPPPEGPAPDLPHLSPVQAPSGQPGPGPGVRGVGPPFLQLSGSEGPGPPRVPAESTPHWLGSTHSVGPCCPGWASPGPRPLTQLALHPSEALLRTRGWQATRSPAPPPRPPAGQRGLAASGGFGGLLPAGAILRCVTCTDGHHGPPVFKDHRGTLGPAMPLLCPRPEVAQHLAGGVCPHRTLLPAAKDHRATPQPPSPLPPGHRAHRDGQGRRHPPVHTYLQAPAWPSLGRWPSRPAAYKGCCPARKASELLVQEPLGRLARFPP